MCRHGIVSFLENERSLEAVDPDFRELVRLFHQIPFCATFGVSCSGHFEEISRDGRIYFRPGPWGHLNIIVLPDPLYIRYLLETLHQVIASCEDAFFRKINHPFGPSEGSNLEVWEIRIGDNGCLGSLKMGENYCGEFILKVDYPSEYITSRFRLEQIRIFWASLEVFVGMFCRNYGFRNSDLEKRVKEISDCWQNKA